MATFTRRNRGGKSTDTAPEVSTEETTVPTQDSTVEPVAEVTTEPESTVDTTEPESTVDPSASSTVVGETVALENAETEEKKVVRVKVEDLGEVSAITADDDAPPVTRERSRRNPYDDVVKSTYDSGFYQKTEAKPKGQWAKQSVGNVYAAMRLIRNAASFHELGVEIRHELTTVDPSKTDDENLKGPGTVWFRGKPKKVMGNR